jgi:hypothetical protein
MEKSKSVIGVPQGHGFHGNHAFSLRERRVDAPVSLRFLAKYW